MGGFLGIGGSSAKTDRANVLTGFSSLKNIFNTGFSSGTGDVGSAEGYWKNILSGNRTSVAQAAAPTTNAVLAQSDAAKRAAVAGGTARGGGTAATNADANARAAKTVDDALFGARGGAAGELAKTGTGEMQIGATAANDLTQNAITARKEDYDINLNTQQHVADFAGDVLGAFGL